MRRLLLVPLLLLVPSLARAIPNAQGWCEAGQQTVLLAGITSTTQVQASFPQCTVTVYVHGGGLATLVTSTGASAANPFTAQTNGQWEFYAANGRYDVTMSGAGIPSPVTYSDVILLDNTGAGTGSVTLVTVSNLAPLFTVTVANPSSTPSVVYTLTPAAPHTYFGNNGFVPQIPAYDQPLFTDLAGTLLCTQMPALFGTISTVQGTCQTTGSLGVTSFATNDITLFGGSFATTTVLTPTTTPVLSFNLLQAIGGYVWGNCTGTYGYPDYCAITDTMLSVNVRRQSCTIVIGSDNAASSVLANADLTQGNRCFIPAAATLLEIGVVANAGTPSIIMSRDRLGTVVNLLTGALVAGAGTSAYQCANATGTTSLNGISTCNGTLENPALLAGDYLSILSGTAGGTAKRLSITMTWTVN